MRTVTKPAAMQRQALQWRSAAIPVAFVPTMGALHHGHISLIHRARKEVGPNGVVVVSVFVNPTQFGPKEDLSNYPRDLARDRNLCRNASATLLFAPTERDMYSSAPDAPHSTWVIEDRLSRSMEGQSRPTHFRGVTTVVAKLFNLVLPTVAVFGAKDFQQVAVVQQMVRDLNFPLRLVVAPTLREPDGLALSSRNQYLSPTERRQATVLWQALQAARKIVRANPKGVPTQHLQSKLRQLIQKQPAAKIDYITFFDPKTLAPKTRVTPGSRMALAVFIGRTRLIDNAQL